MAENEHRPGLTEGEAGAILDALQNVRLGQYASMVVWTGILAKLCKMSSRKQVQPHG